MKSMVVKVPRSKVMLYPITVSLELVKLPSTFRVTSLEQLSKMIADHVPPNWSYTKGSSTVVLANLSSASVDSNMARVSFCVTIHEDLTWGLTYEQKPVPQESLFMFERKLTSVSAIRGILDFLDKKAPSLICAGNDDEKFHSLPQYGKGVFLDVKGMLWLYNTHKLIVYLTT